MYIRKTTSKGKNGKVYTNYLLVESVSTPKGPRQRTIVSLGNLEPRTREEWHQLAKKVERALDPQQNLLPEDDPEVASILEKAEKYKARDAQKLPPETIEVRPEDVRVEKAREAGTVHVGHHLFQQLHFPKILQSIGFSTKAAQLTELMVLNRLIAPASEHAMPDWIDRTALPDLLGSAWEGLHEDRLYRHLDALHPHREALESALAERENTLFGLDTTVFLYDLTSTYFEGQMLRNPQARRGYSRDKRPDCKQLVVGLVLNQDGFPRAHEVFDGNRVDTTTVEDMLTALQQRQKLSEGGLVIVDRGMSSVENLTSIRSRKLHYLVACRQSERDRWLAEFEAEDGWKTVKEDRQTGEVLVRVKPAPVEGETLILCHSAGRREKDRAIREKHEKKFLTDLGKLAKQVETGRISNRDRIHESIGRLLERYPRVARYYAIGFDAEAVRLVWTEQVDARRKAEDLDGAYLLRTSRTDLGAEEAWKVYMLLTRVESAFRDMKSPLWERPIFHQLEHRAQAHILLCVLAYHLLVAVEHQLRLAGDHRTWETIREVLRTHQVVTVVLPTKGGDVLRIRRGTAPEACHREIYERLGMPLEIMKPVMTWERRE